MSKTRKRRTSSRLQKIEDQKNTRQAALFIALSMAFLGILLIVGLPAMEKLIIWMGNRNSDTEDTQNDIIPPSPPKLISPYEATNSAFISITGYAEPDSKVTLFLNDSKTAQVVTPEDGEFEFSNITLYEGENEFQAIATDLAENQSEKSVITTVKFDNQIPELELISPSDGDRFFDEENEIIVGGKTSPDAKLRVNNYVVIVDSEGNFAKRFSLSNGDNKIEVKAYDEAGNQITKELTVYYQD
jgi:hypothetical protein